MNEKQVLELTEDFFKSTVVIHTPIDTSRAVIPAPRRADQIIADEVKYFATKMTVELRMELRAELKATQAERDEMKKQRKALEGECAAVAGARQQLRYELDNIVSARQQLRYELDNIRTERRVAADRYYYETQSNGLCTPSRNMITGR